MNIDSTNNEIKNCSSCEGLNKKATHDSEATLNAPGYGDIKSNVFIIGQSLCGSPCINSQIPFTGGCGVLLDTAFERSGVKKDQIYITNVVKCHPPKNRPSKAHEIKNCQEYLENELNLSSPNVIICLGADARNHFDKKAKLQTSDEVLINGKAISIHYLYHPSFIQNRRPKEEREQYVSLITDIIIKYYV